MPLGTEVGLGPGHIVLGGDPAPPTERGTAAPQLFSACLQGGPKEADTLFIFAITLSILDRLAKFFTAANSSKFPTKPILGYPPHLKYVAALLWKT